MPAWRISWGAPFSESAWQIQESLFLLLSKRCDPIEFRKPRNSFFLRGGTMKHWLMKSEPGVFGVDDLARAPRKTAAWWGVRNYQARNFMRDQMEIGDGVFFYHSSCPEP